MQYNLVDKPVSDAPCVHIPALVGTAYAFAGTIGAYCKLRVDVQHLFHAQMKLSS